MTTNTCSAVMQKPLFTNCSYYAQYTNAGMSAMPAPVPIPLCDKRAVQNPPILINDFSCGPSLWGFGCFGAGASHTGNAVDTTVATNVYGKQKWTDIFSGGLKGYVTNLFAGGWLGAQQTGYNLVPNLVVGGLNGVGNMVKGIGNMAKSIGGFN